MKRLLSFAVLFACPALHALPVIYPRSVVNAASYMATGLPAGSIAQGSVFTIYGTGLGPAQGVSQTVYPLTVAFSGVSIVVVQGNKSVSALPLYVSAGQLNVLMPSNASLGWSSIYVTYNGGKSNPSPVNVVHDSPGIFTFTGTGLGPAAAQNVVSGTNLPVNSLKNAATPGQTVILYLTGLGPITTADTQAPPVGSLPTPVEVWVGGKPATIAYSGRSPCCSGLDQINFVVPADAPNGCWVPVSVRTAKTTLSNFTSIALSANGGACSDASNSLSAPVANGGTLGILSLTRMTIREDVGVNAPIDVATDFLNVALTRQSGGLFVFAPWLSAPPSGTCTVYQGSGDYLETGIVPEASSSTTLDAGSTFQIVSGARQQTASILGTTYPLGSYVPVQSLPNQLFLQPGDYAITGTGGVDVGAIQTNITVPTPLNWTNRDSITTVTRSQPLTINWTGGQKVAIVGVNSDLPTNSSAIFFCIAPTGATSFTVPSEILSALGPTQPYFLKSKSVIYVTSQSEGTFTASGLSTAVKSAIYMTGKTVIFK